jgi:hypothetical protein
MVNEFVGQLLGCDGIVVAKGLEIVAALVVFKISKGEESAGISGCMKVVTSNMPLRHNLGIDLCWRNVIHDSSFGSWFAFLFGRDVVKAG